MSEKPESKDLRPTERFHGITPFEAMDRFFENFFPPGWTRGWHGGWPSWSELKTPFAGRTPRVDVIDRDEAVVVCAELEEGRFGRFTVREPAHEQGGLQGGT